MIDKFDLPKTINTSVEIEVDEMKGEYICKKCKGWGYVNDPKSQVVGVTSFPINLCPDCEGSGIIDWIKRPIQGN
jgi:DnaJ-class molecular chaperone